MNRLLPTTLLWLALCLSAQAQPQCPQTPAPGTSNSMCASTAFVTNSATGLLNALCKTAGAFPIYNGTSASWVCSTLGGTGSAALLNGSLNVTGQSQFGTLPWVQANVYAAGSANSLSFSVRGTNAAPVTDGGATAIFQSVGNQAANLPGVTLYSSWVKRMTTNLSGGRGAWFEANDQVGGAGSFAEGGRASATCTGGTGGNCEGMVGTAAASVAYSYLNGFEGQIFNNSGTDATTTFSSAKFASPYLATSLGANKADAGFITNPFNVTPFISGYYVAVGSVSDAAFRSDAALVHGVDLSRGTCSSDCYNSPGFAVNGSGVITGSAYKAGATAGVSCSGTPTAAFASVNGIVTHC